MFHLTCLPSFSRAPGALGPAGDHFLMLLPPLGPHWTAETWQMKGRQRETKRDAGMEK